MSWRTPENLSADGIATTLGFADAATMVAAINAGGTSILSGTAVPTTEGVDGDFYLRTTNTQFYGPKTAGAWGAGVSLIGATGATGAAGATGATGPAGPAPSGTGLVQVASGVASTLALGTALHGVRVNAAGTAYETAAISASDSTKLALDGSNDMAANISFSGETAATGGTTREIGFNASGGFINAPTGDIALQAMVNNVSLLDIFKHGVRTGIGDPGNGTVAFTTNGVTRFEYDVNQFVCSVPLHCESNLRWTGTQTSAGNSVANVWRDSSAGLNINVATGAQINFRRDGTLLGYFGGGTYAFDIGDYIGTGAGIVKYTSVTIYSVTPSMVAHTTGNATICAGATGTTYPEVVAHGLSETAYAGAIEVKAGAVARTNNGTWTNVFSLAKGEYHGDFWIYDNIGDGHGRLPISNTTLGTIVDNASAPTYVDSGSEAAGNIAFRVSGGNLQVNVGTSVTASLELSIIFKGLVT